MDVKTPKQRQAPYNILEDSTASETMFMDSGAFSLYFQHLHGKSPEQAKQFPKSAEFREYVKAYAAFLRAFKRDIDVAANVDVIFNPEASFEALEILEGEGVKVMPVIHMGESMVWVQKYLDKGYDYLGFGGFASVKGDRDVFLRWINSAFTLLCPESNKRLPIAKTHGFAVTSWSMLMRFPWYSVDSTSWIKAAAYGGIYVPRKSRGAFSFEKPPLSVCVSQKSPSISEFGRNFSSMSSLEREMMEEWLASIQVPLGRVDRNGNEIERGVLTHHKPRSLANLVYFEQLAASVPKYPWPYIPSKLSNFKDFGL